MNAPGIERINPNSGTLAGVDTALSPGSPSAVGAAYTNNAAGATVTTLFVIDSTSSHLNQLGGVDGSPSPNGGVLTDIGPLGVTLGSTSVGFDIAASGMAYASLTVGGLPGLYSINLSTGEALMLGSIGGGGTVTGLAVAPKPAITVNDVSVVEGNSGTTSLDFTLTLSMTALDTVSVDVETADGTATAGSDYTAVRQTITIPAGQTTQTVSVAVNGDTTLEPDETFTLNLNDPVNATLGNLAGTGTILNDETDADGDGVSDAEDGCPNDPAKTSPGACGCGNPDTDSDGDGIADCVDNCPNTPNADQADSDGDGIGDACEPAPANSACGVCGAGSSGALSIMMAGWIGIRGMRRRKSD